MLKALHRISIIFGMDISSLPFFTPLAKDYLTRFESSPIHEFFSISPDAPHEQIRTKIDQRLLRERSLPFERRKSVVEAIRKTCEQAGDACLTNAIIRNLELLESPDTLAVVTGQQAGILGGPIYTFYKAFTAIQLAKSLSEQFQELSFVPIFWIESEDHDLDEVSKIHLLGEGGSDGLKEIKYTPSSLLNEALSGENERWRKQVGPTLLEEAPLKEFFEKMRASLSTTPFSDEIDGMLRRIYAPGRSFAVAFASILLEYFGNDGLLVIDANSRELKSFAVDLFRREIETSPQLSEKIILQSVRLEGAYHAQVKPRALNLFYVNEHGDRLPLVEREPGANSVGSGAERTFFLTGSRKVFSLSELLTELETRPERFSPNVVMRPHYQDGLLPTVAYVAGPGEIAYFAQFQTAYEWSGLPMPLIHPRVSATLIEERLERILAKFHISAEDILSGADGQNSAIFDALIDSKLPGKFERAIGEVDITLEALRDSVSNADQTLNAALTALKGKVLTTIRDFQNKTLAAERKRHATEKAQLDKLFTALIPSGELQERELNLAYFLNKYGPSFIESLKRLLTPMALDFHEHHILHLKDLAAQQNIVDSPEELPMPRSG
jgi:bacillithiol biosynthesis cysteine-adding enzyme BshC